MRLSNASSSTQQDAICEVIFRGRLHHSLDEIVGVRASYEAYGHRAWQGCSSTLKSSEESSSLTDHEHPHDVVQFHRSSAVGIAPVGHSGPDMGNHIFRSDNAQNILSLDEHDRHFLSIKPMLLIARSNVFQIVQ